MNPKPFGHLLPLKTELILKNIFEEPSGMHFCICMAALATCGSEGIAWMLHHEINLAPSPQACCTWLTIYRISNSSVR